MDFRTHHAIVGSCLLTGFLAVALAAPVAAQSTTSTQEKVETTPATAPATTSTTDDVQATETKPVGTSGTVTATATDDAADQSPASPIQRSAPAGLGRPSYWTANAGFEADTHNTGYGFIGPQYVKPFAPKTAWIAGANANYLYYEYPNGSGDTRVTAPGMSARGGVMFGATNYVSLTAGPSFKHRMFHTRDAAGNILSKSDDNVWGLGFGVDASYDPTSHNNLYGIYDYNSSDGYQWTRLAFKQQVTNFGFTGGIANYVGVEGIGQGNSDIHSTQFGAFWETAFVPSRLSVMVRAGWKRSTYPLGGADQSGPWFAIGFWHRLR